MEISTANKILTLVLRRNRHVYSRHLHVQIENNVVGRKTNKTETTLECPIIV